jgi:sigma-E factor negative regulatory protein RseA
MKNQLSALVDGELEIQDSEHIVTALKSKGELTDAWKHYHLIGDAMRGNNGLSPNFSDKVMQALEAEPTVLVTSKQSTNQHAMKHRKVKTPVFWSVAASAAAVMFVGLMVFKMQLGESEDMSAVEIAQNLPLEYLQAHQSAAPSGSAYYIQSASFKEPQQ